MKRDIFRRGIQMTHKFGELETMDDPNGGQTFDFYAQQKRTRVSELSNNTSPVTVQRHGEHQMFNPPRSPVCKPGGGYASIAGPAPDWAEAAAATTPVSTKKRKFQGG